MRLRRIEAKAWELSCDRQFLYAGSGRGSTVAACKQAARSEAVRVGGHQYAQSLLDLVKAFERIPYRVLLREAQRLKYPIRLIRLAIITYRLPWSSGLGRRTLIWFGQRGALWRGPALPPRRCGS